MVWGHLVRHCCTELCNLLAARHLWEAIQTPDKLCSYGCQALCLRVGWRKWLHLKAGD